MDPTDQEQLRILLIGNGGREHALAWKLSESPIVDVIYVAPGNGGTAQMLPKVSNVPSIQVSDFSGLVEFSRQKNINLVIPGPEQPLVDGVVDYIRARLPNVRIFGPAKQAAVLEGSKAFAKDFMMRHGIPTARYQTFCDFERARDFISHVEYDVVLKATGLAAGKGVIIPQSRAEALSALEDMMVRKAFGPAGEEVVIEERLIGQEISVLSFCDGYTAKSLPPAQDHKQVNDGDTGPNTGGMGCYGPAKVATSELIAQIHREVLQPTLDGLRKERRPFVGLLFTGFMITSQGPRTLEYNVRFGDPETQTLLPLMLGDLAEVILACTDGYLDSIPIPIKIDFSTTVIAAAGGYPASYSKGDLISITGTSKEIQDGHIFHAGTSLSSGDLKTAGGRVIAATYTAPSLEKSVSGAYKIMDTIRFPKMHFRKDIAHHALARELAQEETIKEEGMTYASAGVSISSGNAFVERIRPLVVGTARSGSPAGIGGFGGSFNLCEAGFDRAPTLITGTDGVGTKLMIAHALNCHDTIGIDLVAMNANDIVVCGAEPLYLTDVYSCNTLDVDIAVDVVRGICNGCVQAGCALLGGETAEMGAMFKPGDYDVTATVTGAISQGRPVLPNKEIMKAGDILVGLASSGCHSNGFSLIRKVVEKEGLKYEDRAPWVGAGECSIGKELLSPTRIYVKPLLEVVRKDLVKGMAHITGGGLVENIPRMLPKNLSAELDGRTWPVPPVLKWLKQAGRISDHEFSRVFNTGLGMVIVIAEEHVKEATAILRNAGETVYQVGVLKARKGDGCTILHTDTWT